MRPSQTIPNLEQRIRFFDQQLSEGESAFFEGDLSRYRAKIEDTGRFLGQLCQSGLVEVALTLEPSWYQRLVKKIESDDHYAACFRYHSSELWSAGRGISPGPAPNGDADCIAFVAQNSVLLGHTEVMLLIMQGWVRRFPTTRLIFIGFTPCQPALAKRLTALGVITITPSDRHTPIGLAEWLRKAIAAVGARTAIWMSLPIWVPFLFGYRVAQRQILWSLKFHAVHLGEEVVHIGMTKEREGIVNIHGRPWLAFQPPLAVAIKKRDTAERAELRGVNDNKFLFATLAREEKFNSVHFAQAVATILDRCPGSVFLFTGRSISPTLKNALVERGVAGQATFIGWVDTELCADIIDCFLETFPFGCGVTGMQALSHGTPVISLWDTDTLPRYYFEQLAQASRFHQNWRVTNSRDEYVDAAVRCFESWLAGKPRRPIPSRAIFDLDSARYSQFFDLVVKGRS